MSDRGATGGTSVGLQEDEAKEYSHSLCTDTKKGGCSPLNMLLWDVPMGQGSGNLIPIQAASTGRLAEQLVWRRMSLHVTMHTEGSQVLGGTDRDGGGTRRPRHSAVRLGTPTLPS